VIYYWAERLSMDPEHVRKAVASDKRQLEEQKEDGVNLPG
jgi:hypothetical protein